MEKRSALVWFRRDLRLTDNTALHQALQDFDKVYCAFVFDTTILQGLPRADRRIEFILHSLHELDAALREYGGGLLVVQGDPCQEIPALAERLKVLAVHANRDYEPDAIARDAEVSARLGKLEIEFLDYKDQVIFERDEVLTQGGTPFSVFTPYKNAWLKRLSISALRIEHPDENYHRLSVPQAKRKMPSLKDLGFDRTDLADMGFPLGMSGAQTLFDDFQERIASYKEARDFPSVRGCSYLSTHLRFGTISIRQLASYAHHHGGRGAETWLSELIWREFYMMILWQRPDVIGHCFKREYDDLKWDNDQTLWRAWCAGKTGYPLIDAAMRQINQSGYMHNRLRMVTASFLTKDLGIDWKWGERYFAEHLNDYELSSNNGGWQWAAFTGCDAQPWFRIFNPVTQSEKFDPEGKFIRRYVPELADVPTKFIHAPWTMKASEMQACGVTVGKDYPAPVVDHAFAREKTLARFKSVTRSQSGEEKNA